MRLRGAFELLVFKGVQKTTLIDFPGKVASTLFLPKCNFKCPFCYNSQLVLDQETGTSIPETKALQFLDQRKGFLDAACITGGEPLLHKTLPQFCQKLKQKGLLVKVDTNGSKPEMLQSLLEKKLVDYVAMDIKSSLQSYDKAAGTKVDKNAIQKSVETIKNSQADYEFRMTVVPSLHTEKDIREIGKWLKGSKRFLLQQFNSNLPLLDKSLQGTKPYTSQKCDVPSVFE